jgi:hypothetical protein
MDKSGPDAESIPMLMMVRLNQRSRPPSSWIKYCVGTGTAADEEGVEPVTVGSFAAVDVDGAVVKP